MKIGKKLRQLRKDRGITLNELSEKSGVALATLSRMENNKMTGTLEAHQNICKALNTSLAELYAGIEEESKTVESVPRKRRTEHFVHSPKARYELLVTKTMDKKIMPLVIRLDPGGKTQPEENRTGVEKFIYILSGAMTAVVGKSDYSLKTGDSLYFDASLPHTFTNKGRSKAEAICVISPPAL
ncbi:MAG: cupin domain-containing protein [Candidatus Omnitrophica bacterium]|nr:cupin domain-containing protein [Candidatus Omnitrophota bacterium]